MKHIKLKIIIIMLVGLFKMPQLINQNPKYHFLEEKLKLIFLQNLKSNLHFSKTINSKMIGKYSFDGLNFLKFNILNNLKNDLLKTELDGEYRKKFKDRYN